MTARTPTKHKKKNIPAAENVEQEFTQRFVLLFTSLYETPSIDEITTFPPAPEDTHDLKSAPAKLPPFNSGVWDLRLKKAIESRLNTDKMTSDSLSEQVLQLRESLATDTTDLSDVFVPRKVERPAVPRYCTMIARDEEETKASFKSRGRSQTENIAEIGRLFSERLARQEELARGRRYRRYARAHKLEEQHKEFVSHLHQSKIPPDALRLYLQRLEAESKERLATRHQQFVQDREVVVTSRPSSPRQPAEAPESSP